MQVSRHDEVLVIALRGELDFDDAEDMEAVWDTAREAALPVTAVDLSQLAFADSMLLNALLAMHRHHEAMGRSLVLLGPLQPTVSRLLDVTGTSEYFRIASTGPSPHS
ncbi:anti-anti-sigma factor [Actinacidiphila rubida]|uniref:Anti-anti-sigma factor n=1 Tax=Actinacidiphila rubida TaxID=310780 RepID=A0A1H8EEN5_9ACTN|nr:anti-anti-sigma factor [Actinacidiphila rubida]